LIDSEFMRGSTLGSSIMILRRETLASIVAAFLLAPSIQGQDLPDGDGKDLVLKVCTVCHEATRIASKKRTKEEWNETVDKMAARGAKASDEEFETIVNYLAKYLGPDQPPEKNNR
jgi:Quinohemoprotein amine dehydrogenase A, alpha subunit, haem binding